jgi:hypothetical protein
VHRLTRWWHAVHLLRARRVRDESRSPSSQVYPLQCAVRWRKRRLDLVVRGAGRAVLSGGPGIGCQAQPGNADASVPTSGDRETGRRLYIAPEEALPVGRWDFTRPDLLEEAIASGERDAERNEALLNEFLEADWSASEKRRIPHE